jgi:hypothetical protein
MNECTRFSTWAGLAVVGLWMQRKGIWQTVERHVHIKQKVIDHTPLAKLLDAFINILAGGHGIVEVNTRVRPERGLQQAFGREGCAEQSVVSETLNHCEPDTVEQMRQALGAIFGQHSQTIRHNYREQLLLLDVDMSGMPAGRQGEAVTKGYFSGQKNRRGRQVGRVTATLYDEIVAERLYGGKRQLDKSLPELVAAAEQVLELDEEQRPQVILRVDAGGGTVDNINGMLQQGYQVLVKVKTWSQACKLARSVTTWYLDPKVKGREVGWVQAPYAYAKPTRQLAIRKRKRNGQWSYHVLVFTLTNDQLFWLARQPVVKQPTDHQVLCAALAAYDLRSGGLETSNKGSKQGLGLTKRNKRKFSAQQMLVLLAQLAYNLITWTRRDLSAADDHLSHFGPLRFVRDLFSIPGLIELDAQGHVLQITLRSSQPHAWAIAHALAGDDLSLILGEI